MNPAELPNNVLRRMSPVARKALNLQTSEEASAKFVARNERELQTQIGNLLRLRKIWFTQSRCDRKTSNVIGTPDFLFACHGQAVALEVKFEKGKLSPEQETTHAKMRANGWDVYIVRSVAEVKELLDNVYATTREGVA